MFKCNFHKRMFQTLNINWDVVGIFIKFKVGVWSYRIRNVFLWMTLCRCVMHTCCKFSVYHWLRFQRSTANRVKVKLQSYNWSLKADSTESHERSVLECSEFGWVQVIQEVSRGTIKVLLWNIRVRWVQEISSTSPSSALICSGRCAC